MFTCQSIHVYISMSIKPVMHLSLPDVNPIFFLFIIALDTFKTYSLFSPRQQIFELKSSSFRPRQCNYAKILPKKFTKIWRKYRCGRPKIFGVLSMFSSILEQQFVPAEGVELLCCFDLYSQINLVSIKVMYLPRN